jgi:hypothetical protein
MLQEANKRKNKFVNVVKISKVILFMFEDVTVGSVDDLRNTSSWRGMGIGFEELGTAIHRSL